jgi:hypothetical protein
MALSMTANYENNVGITASVDNSYIKVTRLNGNKENIQIELSFFVSSSEPNPFRIEAHSFTPSLSGNNFIAQAYEHLKTLDEFSSATDV